MNPRGVNLAHTCAMRIVPVLGVWCMFAVWSAGCEPAEGPVTPDGGADGGVDLSLIHI